VAAEFRSRGVPVVMGGIHASMRPDEATTRVDAVVTGEAEPIWAEVLADVQRGALKPRYAGAHADMDEIPSARHDLLTGDYACGAIQTTRGCPLSCSFCSVTAFNGHRYRQRPIADVVREFGAIQEKHVLIVDDNLIGTRPEHIARAKDLFRAMIRAKLGKQWIAQATINMADDEELLTLAAQAGCTGVFIGFESLTVAGLRALGGKRHILEGRDFADSVRRIQRHKILVAGSFIMGLDTDEPGIGRRIAEAALRYGVDVLNAAARNTAVGRDGVEGRHRGRQVSGRLEVLHADVPRRALSTFRVRGHRPGDGDVRWDFLLAVERLGRKPFTTLVSNLSYRGNLLLSCRACRDFLSSRAPGQTA
jgi:radical SAM superfamily enzyme YgiQ (UPF0313 family)